MMRNRSQEDSQRCTSSSAPAVPRLITLLSSLNTPSHCCSTSPNKLPTPRSLMYVCTAGPSSSCTSSPGVSINRTARLRWRCGCGMSAWCDERRWVGAGSLRTGAGLERRLTDRRLVVGRFRGEEREEAAPGSEMGRGGPGDVGELGVWVSVVRGDAEVGSWL